MVFFSGNYVGPPPTGCHVFLGGVFSSFISLSFSPSEWNENSTIDLFVVEGVVYSFQVIICMDISLYTETWLMPIYDLSNW